jgi:hypothetical protein
MYGNLIHLLLTILVLAYYEEGYLPSLVHIKSEQQQLICCSINVFSVFLSLDKIGAL